MTVLGRARIVVLLALTASIVIVATEFPFSELMGERASVARGTAQLSLLQAQDRVLASQVKEMSQPATIERIAHEEYGLISKGERSVVVLPSAADAAGGPSPLRVSVVPRADLFPSDAIVAQGESGASVPAAKEHESFLSRLLKRIEFWKAST